MSAGDGGETLAALALAEEENLDHVVGFAEDGLVGTQLVVDLVADHASLCFALLACSAFSWGLVGRGSGDDCEGV